MKPATIQEIKKELSALEATQLKELLLRLARFKNDNKELLTYLLFQEQDEAFYIESVKEKVKELFGELTNPNVYYIKKGLRKILRMLNKQIKYSRLPTTELDLRIHLCQQIQKARIPLSKSTVLMNLYQQQLKKIQQVLSKLEEDLQYDYRNEIESLQIKQA